MRRIVTGDVKRVFSTSVYNVAKFGYSSVHLIISFKELL
jgi:ppGpp synthetase/RelA/SpoT-type nucleotidyltranferase